MEITKINFPAISLIQDLVDVTTADDRPYQNLIPGKKRIQVRFFTLRRLNVGASVKFKGCDFVVTKSGLFCVAELVGSHNDFILKIGANYKASYNVKR